MLSMRRPREIESSSEAVALWQAENDSGGPESEALMGHFRFCSTHR